MGTEADPVVGRWYSHLDKGQEFKVVALDETARTVEIQYFDGDIEELDLDSWYGLDIETIEPPEDWTGSVDDVERDDLGYTDDGMRRGGWTAPLDEFNVETETERKRREREGELPEDEWGEGRPEEEPWKGEE